MRSAFCTHCQRFGHRPMPRWMKWLETHRRPFAQWPLLDELALMGFWEMADGDWYVHGRWNWRCWQRWDRVFARWDAEGIQHLPMPLVPRALKRIFT